MDGYIHSSSWNMKRKEERKVVLRSELSESRGKGKAVVVIVAGS